MDGTQPLLPRSSPTMTWRIPVPSDIIYNSWGIIYPGCRNGRCKPKPFQWWLLAASHQPYLLILLLPFLLLCFIAQRTEAGAGFAFIMQVAAQIVRLDWAHSHVFMRACRDGKFLNVTHLPCQHVSRLSTPCCGCGPRSATCLLADSLPCADTPLQLSPGPPAA